MNAKNKFRSIKAKGDLLYFTRLFFNELRGSKFISNWHHKDICKALQETAQYKYELLNINIPPRHSKTELVLNFIAQSLAINPSANFLYITASDELRSETSTRIRDIVTHPLYKELFDVELKKDQQAKNLWRTNSGGGLKTATIFGQITGFGAGQMIDNDLVDHIRNFEGAIVLDDINKIMDAIADTANNQKSNSVILNTILSRKNSSDTPIINIQQRAGLNDATATLTKFYKDSPKAKNLVLPIIDKDNKPLWPFKEDTESINRLRNHPDTKQIFECQYMQSPTFTEGVLFPENKLQRFTLAEFNNQTVEAKIGVVDTADDGTDFLSCPIAYKVGQKYYIVDVVYTQDNFDVTKPRVLEKIQRHELDYLKIETNSQGKDFYRFMKENVNNTTIRGEFTSSNKETRILMQSDWILDYCVFRSDYEEGSDYDNFIKGLTKYLKMVKNKEDDAPDTLAALAVFVKKLFR